MRVGSSPMAAAARLTRLSDAQARAIHPIDKVRGLSTHGRGRDAGSVISRRAPAQACPHGGKEAPG